MEQQEHSLKGLYPVFSIPLFNILVSKGYHPVFANGNFKRKGGWTVFFNDSEEVQQIVNEFMEMRHAQQAQAQIQSQQLKEKIS